MTTVTETAFAEYLRRLEGLTAGQQSAVERLTSQAMGYVWGWQDAGADPKDSEAAWDFAYAYGIHAAMYESGEIGMRNAIQNAWTNWREQGQIVRSYLD